MEKKLSILVIDDEAPFEDIYKAFLAQIGARVTFCDHPQKGWHAIDREEYDLIITDLKMPIITGDEFIPIIRASKLNAHTPIILCSAFIDKLIITEITRESKIYLLSKPFDSKTLLDLVTKTVGVKKWNLSENQTINEKWLQTFLKNLSDATSEQVKSNKIDHFELWNYESISLSLFVAENNEHLCVTLLMKQNTFLKIAGAIQGTQYKEIESEALNVWQEHLKSISTSSSRVTFSKVRSQDIITLDGEKSGFYKIDTKAGEIQAYFN